MKITDFEVLTFDCYGTLIDWEAGIVGWLKPWAEKHGVGAGEAALLAAFSDCESDQQEAEPGALYPKILAATLDRIGERFGVTPSEEERAAFGNSVKDWPAFPDSAEALAYLKRHYKLAILSNIDRASFATSNAKLGVEFDLVVTAQDVGSYKPAPGHFEQALEQLAAMGHPKDKILHTAQSLYHDHVPAKGFGLASIWINRRADTEGWGATPAPPSEVAPDWEVPSMAAMVELHKKHLGE
ncbi:MAG: haloacid dehalogenase type II [Rhodospirillales bacterium]|nr:haloacid dehalogenase type II [Rhodospirillales bacterium]